MHLNQELIEAIARLTSFFATTKFVITCFFQPNSERHASPNAALPCVLVVLLFASV